MRTIIYCQTILQCSTLYNFITQELGEHLYKDRIFNPKRRIVEMMHSQTPNSVKDHILEQFSKTDGHLRVLIATIAYGMGVNCKGVRRVIHLGPSKTIEAYIQESGRCGRQGENSYAILLFTGALLREIDDSMRDYIRSQGVCRRETLLKHFSGRGDSNYKPRGHQCCDWCAENCKCQVDHCDMDLNLPTTESKEEILQSRNVSEEQKKLLTRKLMRLHKEIVAEVSNISKHVTYPTTLMQFGDIQIEQVIQHCDKLFSTQDILHFVEIWHKKHAQMVLNLLKEVFGDIECDSDDDDSTETDSDDESITNSFIMNAIANDKSFLSLMDHSEWELDSMSMGELDSQLIEAEDEPMIPNIIHEIIPSCMYTVED